MTWESECNLMSRERETQDIYRIYNSSVFGRDKTEQSKVNNSDLSSLKRKHNFNVKYLW